MKLNKKLFASGVALIVSGIWLVALSVNNLCFESFYFLPSGLCYLMAFFGGMAFFRGFYLVFNCTSED